MVGYGRGECERCLFERDVCRRAPTANAEIRLVRKCQPRSCTPAELRDRNACHGCVVSSLTEINDVPAESGDDTQCDARCESNYGDDPMADVAKLPVKTETKAAVPSVWAPFQSLHHEIDRVFDAFDGGFWRTPFRRSLFDYRPLERFEFAAAAPAVDVAEKDDAYEVTAELPGLDEKDIEVKLSNGCIVIKGEKKEEKEEKKKDFYLSERRYGAFERSFRIPEGVDTDKVSAAFQKGVLTITLAKSAEAKKQERKISVKAAA